MTQMMDRGLRTRLEDTTDLTGPAGHRWLLILGALTTLAGLAAILLPRLAALTVEFVIGVLLIVDGVFQGIQTFRLRRRRGFEWKLFSALLAFSVGVILLVFPLTGVLTLSLIIGAFFVVSGVLKMLLAYQYRDLRGSGWLLLIGIVSLVVGGSILLWWPDAAAWLIGVLVGVDLLLVGTWMIALALAVRPGNGVEI